MTTAFIAIDKKGGISMRKNNNMATQEQTDKSTYTPRALSSKELITKIMEEPSKHLTKKQKAEQELAIFGILSSLKPGHTLHVDSIAEQFEDDVRLSWHLTNSGWQETTMRVTANA